MKKNLYLIFPYRGTGGVSILFKRAAEWLADKDYSAWGLLNAGTNVLWHSNKLTTANFNNNSLVVDGMLEYGKTLTPDTTDPNQLSFA